jgi:LemA protein
VGLYGDDLLNFESLLPWGGAALLLFWAVGAYNRLVRLRGQAAALFAVVQGRLRHFLDLADDHLREASGLAQAQALAAPQGAAHSQVWMGLQGARTQFETSLAAAARKPLDAPTLAALHTAHATLQVAWLRVQDECRLYPQLFHSTVEPGWTDNARLVALATTDFNNAVLTYNAAVSQFPAVILAQIFGLRAAGCL